MNTIRKNRKNIFQAIALVIFFCGAALFSSCSEEFLKPVPLSFFEPGATLSTEQGIVAVMAMTDRHLRHYWTHSEDNPGHNSNPMGTEYLFSDLMAYGKTDEGNTQINFLAANMTPTNAGSGESGGNSNGNVIQYFWYETYNGLKYANTIINFIDAVQGLDEATKNAYLGRALFHRAFRYYALVFQFGDVPLVTKIPTVPKLNFRSTKKEAILEMITLDLEKAVEMVPEQKDMAYKGMVNKGACRLLLAKCYLATGQFEKAKTQLDILIDQSGYSLVQGGAGLGQLGELIEGGEPETWPITRNVIWDLHRSQNKMIAANTEAIMVMPNRGQQSAAFRQWLQMRIYGPYWNSGALTSPDGKVLGLYARNNINNYNKQLDITRAVGRGIGVFRPTAFAQYELWNVNGVRDNGDLRHSGGVENGGVGNWVNMTDLKYNDRTSAYYGQNLMLYHPETGALLCTDTVRSWYNWPHYKYWNLHASAELNLAEVNFNGAVSAPTMDGHADIYLYRLAEAYLLRAEAKFYLGQDGTSDVNAVRERARCTELYTTVNIGDIMNERARELHMEEWRNVELKRVSRCLALSGKPDEWGNTYNISTYDKQTGTDPDGGCYWWQRICHYNNFYNKGNIRSGNPIRDQEYTLAKHNMYWPIRQQFIDSNIEGKLTQNYGYYGYDASIPVWETWQEAVADEDRTN